MHRSTAARNALALTARLGLDGKRVGIALCVYAALLLTAALLLATSWAPAGIVAGAAIVAFAHVTAGVALVRRSVRVHAMVATSGSLHAVLTVAWILVLVSA